MDIQAIITLSIAVFAFIVKPGPGIMMVVSRAMGQGIVAAIIALVGIEIAHTFYLSLVLSGLKFAEGDLVFITVFIKALAAVYLIWLGIRGLQSDVVNMQIQSGAAVPAFDILSGAIILTLANPLVIVFYGGILPTILYIPLMTLGDALIVVAVTTTIGFLVSLGYALPAVLSRRFLTNKRLQQVSLFSSCVMILIGLIIGYSALPAKDVLSLF